MKKRLQVQKKEKHPYLMLIPIIIALGFIPLIVHMYRYDVGWQDMAWFPLSANEQIDFFHMWKSIAVMIVGAAMLLLLVWRYCNVLTLRAERGFLLLAAYAFCIILSTACSPYKPQVFAGSYEVLQPFGTMLGYLVICYYTYCMVDSEEKLSVVLRYSMIGVGLIIVIGIFQFAGFDLFKTIPGRFIISDPSYWDKLDQIHFTFANRTVYATLYNPDFLSFYFGLMLPVMIVMLICTKNKILRVLLLIGCILSIICVKGAGADSGYLAIAISLAAAGLILLSRNKKWFRIGLIGGGAAIILVCLACILTPFGNRLEALFLGTERSLETRVLKSMETKNDGVYMDLNGKTLIVSYTYSADTGNFAAKFRNAEGNEVPSNVIRLDDGNYGFQLTDDVFGELTASPAYAQDILCIGIHVDNQDWYFTNQLDGTYYYYNRLGQFDKAYPIPTSTLFRDNAMSGRGIIWDHTIPLLSKHILLGSGSNSYSMEYPQNDYVYKAYNGQSNVYTVKAHNWFLQEWIENGFIGMLCIFGFYLYYFIRSIRIYRRCDLHDNLSLLGFGIWIGTIAYVSAGIANDANVNAAPVFWVMMGLGLSVNRMIENKAPSRI